MSYSSQTTKSYSYSSRSGEQPQSTVTETRTYIDSDGTKRTEKVTYGGDGKDASSKPSIGSRMGNWMQDKMDNLGHKIEGGLHITARKSKPTEARYSRGYSSRRKPEVSSALPLHPGGKSFDEIRKACLQSGRLFEDPDFPAVDSSIFYSKRPARPFVWKRPTEICDDAQLFVSGATRFDVKQGELGDCWLLAAVASLTVQENLLHRVVPLDQGFGDGYAGCFHFQFWRFGQWEDVIIDDRLPTYCDKLVFLHSDEKNEFWSALLEKAYAKLHGSYEALKGGATSEAMEDFTGGVTEMYDFRQNLPAKLFTIMLQAHQRNSLMGCSIEANPGQMEAQLDNGLIMGHAYSITDVRMVNIKTSRTEGKIPMLRIRNPWGNECEWNGAWSDKSQEWNFISESERRQMGLSFAHDGEFWMSYQDFTKNFQKLEICHLGAHGMDHDLRGHWSSKSMDGSWKRRVTAGGCRNFLDTFWTNPQYRVSVTDADDEDDENMGTVIIGLMQKNRRKLREEGKDMLTVGYAIYKLNEDTKGTLDLNFFKYNASVAKSPSFINLREICGRHRLPPAEYCIIPSTFEPNQEGDFLLRIFSEKPNASGEMDEDTSMSPVQPRNSDRGGANSRIDMNRPRSPVPGSRVVDVKHKHGGRPVAELTDADREVDKKLQATFMRIAGQDAEIDAYELKAILNAAYKNEFKFDGFSTETCRSIVAMMDDDKSGKLGFEEFKKVWNNLRTWKGIFKKYDTDQSGFFNSYELRTALSKTGFRVSNGTFTGLVQRFSNQAGNIEFDDFILCLVRMKTMHETFNEMRQPNGTKAEFSLDEFIQTTMYS